jgi:hypothetical protein
LFEINNKINRYDQLKHIAMGGGTSKAKVEQKYRGERKADEAATSAQDYGEVQSSKASRESRRLQKIALGQIDRDYEKMVNFNKVDEVSWDASKLSQRPNEPLSKSVTTPSDQVAPAVV